MMKRSNIGFLCVIVVLTSPCRGSAGDLAVIPAPCRMTEGRGICEVTDRAPTFVRDASIASEGYRLSVSSNGVRIAYADDAGRFYAQKTLEQLCEGRTCPSVEIDDAPAYRWRGVHIDDVRHFFGKDTVKLVITLMARYKMNVLHWHLTDDQGWRLDVPGHPELVRYGAVRPSSPVRGAMMCRQDDGEYRIEQDGRPYGPFFYTEADVREVLLHAQTNYVLVVPEIELPGHVAALLAAHPEFACRPDRLAHRHPRLLWGIEKEVLCLGNDAAIGMMEDVLGYVCGLFPSPFIHIGGDECPTDRWRDCPSCQERIRTERLKDEAALQSWATRRFVKFLSDRGKRVIGWDEYLDGDVPADAIGMCWRNAACTGAGRTLVSGSVAIAKGHDVIMTPHDQTYFYYGQGLADDPFQYGGSGRPFGGGELTLEKVYAFDPASGIPDASRRHVLGGQCCNWSEYTWNEYDLMWKLWPRGCAMAEALWCGAGRPGFEDFRKRVAVHRRYLIGLGVNCATLE